METPMEPKQPRRLEKKANITCDSLLRRRAAPCAGYLNLSPLVLVFTRQSQWFAVM